MQEPESVIADHQTTKEPVITSVGPISVDEDIEDTLFDPKSMPDDPITSSPLNVHLSYRMEFLSAHVYNLGQRIETSLPTQLSATISKVFPSLLADTLKEKLPGLLSDSMKFVDLLKE
ncbi:hypothetical protein Tco_1449687 [Tanacetum coccineum]